MHQFPGMDAFLALHHLVKVEKLNFGDAVRKLAAKAGMPAFKFTKENIEVENKRKKYDEILTIALKHYQKNFSENDNIKNIQ